MGLRHAHKVNQIKNHEHSFGKRLQAHSWAYKKQQIVSRN